MCRGVQLNAPALHIDILYAGCRAGCRLAEVPRAARGLTARGIEVYYGLIDGGAGSRASSVDI